MTIWQWRTHRTLIDKFGLLLPFSRQGSRKRILFISVNERIAHAQVFPYFFHAQDFASIELRELPLNRFLDDDHPYKTSVDAVCFQTWFDLTSQQLSEIIQAIRLTWKNVPIAYFDWFAPTDLRYAETLNDQVVVYLKKQTLRNFDQYNQTTLGDTNLSDYYSHRFNLNEPKVCFHVPESFRKKLLLSPHLALSDYMLPYFMRAFPVRKNRSIDLHARIAVEGEKWYSQMRQEAIDKVMNLEGRLKVIRNSRIRVPKKQFITELFDSKLCLSPFGYGEVCWRDFEAIFTGSLLLKPDMSHINCYPDIFHSYETYVPLNWDLSDLNEKVDYYLHHTKERDMIARNAFNTLSNYFKEKHFLDHTQDLFQRLNLGKISYS